jgi:peptide/nickel transport system substrate-binding protein
MVPSGREDEMAENREHPYIAKLMEAHAAGRVGRREFLRTSTLLGLAAAAAYAFVGSATRGSAIPDAAAAPKKGGKINIGHRVPDIKSPHALNWFAFSNLTFPVVETLTVTGVDNITHPHLVEKWQASDDLRTWTFTLRPNVKWRSGRPFVSEDVVWNIKHLLDPETGSSTMGLMKSYMLNDVEKDGKKTTEIWDANAIEKVDDRTFRLNLKTPQVAIPEHLFQYTNTMLDPAEGGLFKVGSNGTGPYTLVDYQLGKKAVYEARNDYWGEGPYLKTVEFTDLGDDPVAALAALRSHQIDGVYQLTFEQVAAVKQIPDVVIYNAKTANTATISMKVNQKPWDDLRVRQAMRLALDPTTIMRVAVGDLGLPGEHHHVSPIHPDYAQLPQPKQDVAKAKQLLAEAGYPNGLDAEIHVSTQPKWELNAVQAMVQQWKTAGIRVSIRQLPTAQFWEVWNKAPLVYTDWTHRPLGIQMLSLVYRSGVPWNCGEWSNSEFDNLLTQAEGILDVTERRKVMEKLERILQNEGPMALPVWVDAVTAHHKRVKGFVMHPSLTIFTNKIWVADA